MRRVILNEGVTHDPRPELEEHGFLTDTVHYHKWDGLPNRRWLTEADSAGFEVAVTADQSLPFQENLSNWGLGIVVLSDTKWTITPSKITKVVDAIQTVGPGDWELVDVRDG